MKQPKSLLLVVDVQRGFMNEHTLPAVETINKLVKSWDDRDWPVVCSRFINLPQSNWQRLRKWYGLTGEPDTKLAEELNISTPYIFKKSTYSAWSHEVAAICMSEQVRDVVLVGVDTNECVLATAIAIFDDGFTPWLVADATASGGGKAAHEMAVTVLENLLGQQQVINSKEVL
jgi:nicotinamidase-related amidase